MGRVFGVSIGFIAVLAVIWFCSGNGIPKLHTMQETIVQMPTEPEATQTLAPVVGQGQYTFLVAKSIGAYEGQEGLSGVAALELWNTGKSDIKYAEVLVEQQERQLRFVVSYLPAGCGIIVPEKNNTPYTRDGITDFRCLTAMPLENGADKGSIAVIETSRYTLQITNLTSETVGCVRIFYKPYNADRALFEGNVTYCVVIPDLAPGESREIAPYLYASDETKVVAVITE